MRERGLCCYELMEPMRRTVRDRGTWYAVGMVALQVAIMLGCLGGALWLGGVE